MGQPADGKQGAADLTAQHAERSTADGALSGVVEGVVAQSDHDGADQSVGFHPGQRDDLVVGAALRAGHQHGQVAANIGVEHGGAAPLGNLGHGHIRSLSAI